MSKHETPEPHSLPYVKHGRLKGSGQRMGRLECGKQQGANARPHSLGGFQVRVPTVRAVGAQALLHTRSRLAVAVCYEIVGIAASHNPIRLEV